MTMAKIIARHRRYPDHPTKLSTYPEIECHCGHHVYCSDAWANSCDKCETEYNGSGQQLNPRHMWGEETGETFW
jgi:hypothetical protein